MRLRLVYYPRNHSLVGRSAHGYFGLSPHSSIRIEFDQRLFIHWELFIMGLRHYACNASSLQDDTKRPFR